MEHVLIVEPDAALATLLVDCVRSGGWRVDTVSGLAAAAAESPRASTLILANLADQADVEQVSRLCRRPDPPLMIAMAQRDRLDLAIGALRGGARDFLAKPFDVRALERALSLASARRPYGTARLLATGDAEDPSMRALLARAEAAARAEVTIMIHGESATGRRRLARFVHGRSARASRPLVEVDADALEPRQAVTDLFGSERGAFHLAAGGSLLLVEPGALAPHAQQRLLEATIGRTAAEAPRLLLVSERPLREDPRLRPDLRLRLDVVSLRVPPLRERPRELVRLVGVLAEHHAAAQGVPAPRFGPEALAALRAHPFAGNLREVENLAQRAVLCSAGADVDVPALLAARPLPRRPPAPEAPVLELRELERRAIVRALALHAGNRTHAARTLGISVRTLRNKLHQYQLV